ncbi:PTS system transporter subunit IIB [Bacillus sp. TS-2]|nr:PTS system transporter subunit IIB [Bacillus sp. TS-2]
MKISIVCSSGLGTSLLIKIQLERILKEWNVDATIINTDVSTFNSEQHDIVIGAKQIIDSLEIKNHTEYIALENLIDPDYLRQQLLSNEVVKIWVNQ